MPRRDEDVGGNDDVYATQVTNKRTRTDDYEPSQPKQKRQRSRHREGTEGNEELEVEDAEEDMEEVAPDEEEEKRFEEEHEEEIRNKVIGSTPKVAGNIAEMGIIEKIELVQFMCHKYLSFNFGPQINFVIGHNGSGKSAVLSALTVALGGKATFTGRGSGLKSFIREGQSAAEVVVTMKNRGEDAYRHDVYGDSIIISRRFTREGSSSYKIQSTKTGKPVTISTKRDELSAICDHMNIQVDNPMNILTQDSARQFLSASTPADKYKFFLKGTQLSQLSEEYALCMENISQTQKILKNKAELIPDLNNAFKEAMQRFQEASKAREQRHKADELKKELAWAHVASKEYELTAKLLEVEKMSHRLPKVQAEVQKAIDEFDRCSTGVESEEQRLEELGSIDDLNSARNDVIDRLRVKKSEINDLRRDEKKISDDMKQINRAIEMWKEKIVDETKRIESFSQSKREETNRKLEEAIVAYEAAKSRLEDLKEKRATLENDASAAQGKGMRLSEERDGLKESIMDCQRQLKNCAEREKTKLAPFGNNMENVLQELYRMQWHGSAPVGPLGMYVTLKDLQWAPVMRVQLGGLMGAFAITDGRDRRALDQLLKRHGNTKPNIIVAERDIFDFSGGEPSQEYLTVLRALDVSDPYVLRVLVNSAYIEQVLLAKNRAEADQMLLQLGQGTAWSSDFYKVTRFSEGGGQSTLLQRLGNGDPRHQLFPSDDVSTDKRKWQQKTEDIQREYQDMTQEIQQCRDVYNHAQSSLKTLQNEEAKVNQSLRQCKIIRDQLQEEANEELPVGVQSLQEQLQNSEEERALLLTQFKEVAENKARLEESKGPIERERQDIEKKVNEFVDRQKEIRQRIEDLVAERMKAQNSKGYYEKKVAEERLRVDAVQETADILQDEFQAWTAKAEEYCERFHNPRKVDEVQRNLEAVQNALKEREKRHGASVEEMTIEVNKKKAALENAKRDLKTMLSLNKSLRQSVRVRLARWHEFRRHIALRCKIYFSYHLSNRGYFGKVLFDHAQGTLHLKVQTDDQIATQGNREKDPKSLSGGEKSFSTICLLLSLWESIGCPIRCLDEFDVFMDAVNRRITMRMMIDTANASDRKQYILITPQDMGYVHVGSTVRVHRMPDPQRNQGTLSFGQ